MKHYSNDIFPIGLVLSYDFESVNDFYTTENGLDITKNDYEATTLTLADRGNKRHAIGIIFNTAMTMKLAAHQGYHATCLMMQELGIPFSEHSEEAWAHITAWIAECINDFSNDRNGIEDV